MKTKNIQHMQAETIRHLLADAVVQGSYWVWEGNNPTGGRGCFIGCLSHSKDPSTLEKRYGIPLAIVRISEMLFETLPEAAAKRFFRDIPRAINENNKDLSQVTWQFLAKLLREFPGGEDYYPEYVDQVVEILDCQAAGDEYSDPNDLLGHLSTSSTTVSLASVTPKIFLSLRSAVRSVVLSNSQEPDAHANAAFAATRVPSVFLEVTDKDARYLCAVLLRLLRNAPVEQVEADPGQVDMLTVAEGILDSAVESDIEINLESWSTVDNYATNGCGIDLSREQCEKVLEVCRKWIAAESQNSHDYFLIVELPLSNQ